MTQNPLTVDDDPDWSPDGQTLAFTSHGINDPHGDSVTAEIYTISPVQLTDFPGTNGFVDWGVLKIGIR